VERPLLPEQQVVANHAWLDCSCLVHCAVIFLVWGFGVCCCKVIGVEEVGCIWPVQGWDLQAGMGPAAGYCFSPVTYVRPQQQTYAWGGLGL